MAEANLTVEQTVPHTALPWIVEPIPVEAHIDPDFQVDDDCRFWVVDASGLSEVLALVLKTAGGQAEANARLIVTAVNSHAEMLAALKKALADHDESVRVLRRAVEIGLPVFSTSDMLTALAPFRQPIVTAIAKAEGRTA